MKRYKSIMSLTLSVVMALLATLCFSGCVGYVPETKVYGDFLIVDDNGLHELYDFSEEGLQKEIIIIPDKINGRFVDIYYENISFTRVGYATFRESKKLKRVYIVGEENIDVRGDALAYFIDVAFQKTTGIKKFLCTSHNYLGEGGGWCLNTFRIKQFLERHNCVYNGIVAPFTEKGELAWKEPFWTNIQYMYNYEEAPNEGYYWIDDLETGETLSYIPKDPTREGYTFGGWYVDSECTTPYDFTISYMKKDLVKGEYYFSGNPYECWYYPEDYVTYIYAKWIEN